MFENARGRHAVKLRNRWRILLPRSCVQRRRGPPPAPSTSISFYGTHPSYRCLFTFHVDSFTFPFRFFPFAFLLSTRFLVVPNRSHPTLFSLFRTPVRALPARLSHAPLPPHRLLVILWYTHSYSLIVMTTTFDSASPSVSDSSFKRCREDSEMPDEDLTVDGAAQAKIARKEARVIRNRESAQRSRNQRKQYLAGLEVRNRELEEEVRRLRAQSSDGPSKTASPTPTPREASPEQTVLTLAGELGIPPQMVSSGVSLSSVAPPPPDAEIEVKQETAPASVPTNPDLDRLVAQNNALTQRVAMLENLLKQVVAVSNFGGLDEPAQPAAIDIMSTQPSSAVDETFDFNSFIQSNPSDAHTTPTSTSFPITPINSNLDLTSFHPVACHSAVVATSVSYEGEAQQRARGTGTKLDSHLITRERLVKVARILEALAQLRGWTHSSPSMASVWKRSAPTACRSRIRGARRRSRRGMKG